MNKFDITMAREPLVPLLELDDFGPAFKGMSEKTAKKVGRLSNSVRAMAHADEMAAAVRTFLGNASTGGSLDPELTILIRHLVSNINTCVYCSSHQLAKLIDMGVSAEKIENIHDYPTHPAFSEQERAALDFAKALTVDSANISDEICERFTVNFNPRQRVEIALATAAMDVLNKFNDGMRIPIDDEAIDLARQAAKLF
ncbi:MAG: carboxymuconolactone decarboxylase family protein [Rhodospirillales bacterium]